MQRASEYILNGVVGVVTVIALLLGGGRLWRSCVATDGTTTVRDNWQQYASVGQRLGPDSAAVVIVWFGDYQCPYCRTAAADLEKLRAKYPTELATVYRHFPLSSIHATAVAAATASECAAAQGRFALFHRMLYANADSLSETAWTEFALDAGVESLERFQSCLSSDDAQTAIAEDLAAGKALGIRGTPAFLVNGRLVVGYPGAAALERYVLEEVARLTSNVLPRAQ